MATWPTVTDDDGTGTTGTILDNALFALIRDYIGDAWSAVAYAAGNFTGSGTITWTVASGDQLSFAYTVRGKTMTISFYLFGTSVSGTGTNLRITLPAGVTCQRTVYTTYFYSDNGTEGVGLVEVGSGGTVISLYKSSTASNWSASTDNTAVRGQVTIEIA